jgi:choline kinase
MKEISKKVKTEGGEIIEDVKKVREKIEEEGIGLASLGKMFGLFSRKRKK